MEDGSATNAAPDCERVCIRKRGRLKGAGSRAKFREDVRVVAAQLGGAFVWLEEEQAENGMKKRTDPTPAEVEALAVAAALDDGHAPHFCYSPPLAFVTFYGERSKLRDVLRREDGALDGEVCGGRWTVKASTEGGSSSVGREKTKNAWKQVATSHRNFFEESGLREAEEGAASTPSISESHVRLAPPPTPQSSSLSSSSSPPSASVITVNLTKPQNLGSIYRLMACYGCPELNHIYRPSAAPPRWEDKHRMQSIKSLSRGCDSYATRRLVPTDAFVAQLKATREGLLARPPAVKRARTDTKGDDLLTIQEGASSSSSPSAGSLAPTGEFRLPLNRPPIVAIETATGAVDITTFEFPRDCFIMVGSEGSGIDPKILRAMAPGYDRLVYIPMHGPHHSLNVAMALNVALYEWRRQHPAPVCKKH